ANQLGDFVMFLKFRAIHFNECMWIPEKRFGEHFDHISLAGSGRPEKQQVSDWPVRRRHAHKKYLVELEDRIHGRILPHDSGTQERLDFPRGLAMTCGIEWLDGCFFETGRTTRTGPAGHTKPLVLCYLIVASFPAGHRDGRHASP